MTRPDRIDGALVAGAGALTAGLVLVTSGGGPELLFGTVCLVALALLVRALGHAWRTARREQRRAAVQMEPSETARRAVREERRRLSADIAQGLRDHLVRIEVLASTEADARPHERASQIHRATQEASAELRRQLGLLREEPEPPTATAMTAPAATRRPLIEGVAVTLLAVTEAIAYPRFEGHSASWLSVAFTGAAAAAVVGRRFVPGVAAAAVGVVYAGSAVLGTPVHGGFWFLLGPAWIAWTLVSRPTHAWREVAGGGIMVGGIVLGGWTTDRDNLGAALVMIGIASGAAVLTRRADNRAARARDASARRDAELSAATRIALRSERTGFARDLHDLISHAVGLISMQAAAAQVSWPRDPATVAESLAVVRRTAAATVAELDQVGHDAPGPPRRGADVRALVERVRAAGTTVHLSCPDVIDAAVGDAVYRVVQEGLTNVVRHAWGATASVRVTMTDDGWQVRVTDDGPGPTGGDLRGFGLTGLTERVAFAGGVLTYGHEPNGFVVSARFPRDRGKVRS